MSTKGFNTKAVIVMITAFFLELFASSVRFARVPLSVTIPTLRDSQESKVSKVLKRASVGRFFRTGNFYFFAQGFSL
jgi:hypothetical protein